MSSTFSFGNINVNSRKHSLRLETTEDALLSDKSLESASYDFVPVVLADELYSEENLPAIEKFLKTAGLSKYILLSSINCKITKDSVKEDQKTGIIEFYETNKSDFEKYFPKNAPILTVGPALYSLLMEDDIYPSHVQQIIFGKTNFWFSKDQTAEKGHYIFPIESFRDIIETKKVPDKAKKLGPDGKYPVKDTGILSESRDSYKTKLAKIQIASLIKLGSRPPIRYPKLNKIFIDTKEDFEKLFYEPNKNRKDDLLSWDLETSGFSFIKDKIGCITLSFDGKTGYYIPWKIMDYKMCQQLDEILGNNRQCLANGKFDVKFLWQPREYNNVLYGYKVVEIEGRRYKIYNNQEVKTERGNILGEDLMREDTILSFENLEKI